MMDTIEAASAAELNDYFTMRIGERTKPVDDVDTYRFHVAVLYENGRLFEELKIDVGFADPWLGQPQKLIAAALLDFAGIEPATVRAIPTEQHLAEKVHAYTKRYGNRESTRVKDLVDMALLVDEPSLDRNALAQMLRDVFRKRETHDVPAALPPPPVAWRMVFPRLAADLPIPRRAMKRTATSLMR